MAYSQNFPAQRPSFMFDASNAGRIPPNMTYTRASTANVFDGSKHLSSDNILTYSSTFDNASWVPAGTEGNPSGGQTDPSGGTNGYTIVENTDNNWHRLLKQVSGGSNSYAFVLYAKQNAGTRYLTLSLVAGNSNFEAATFDLAGGSPVLASGSSSAFTSVSATQTASGNGYYKCVLKATGNPVDVRVNVVNTTSPSLSSFGSLQYTGDGTSSIDIAFSSLSTTGATDYNATTTQIHREYASSLVSKANNIGRFEVGTDGQSEGILIESQFQQDLTYTEDLTNAHWTKSNTTIQSNAGVAPDGTLTADLIVESDDSGTAIHRCYNHNRGTPASGVQYTFSAFVKAAGRNHIEMAFAQYLGISGDIVFNLTDGTTSGQSGNVSASSATNCGNGWWRVSITTAATTNANALTSYFNMHNGSTYAYEGNGFGSVLVWGANQTQSSHVYSYLKAEGSATTKAADSMSMTDSSLFDNGGGTLYAEASRNAISTYNGIFSVDDGSGSNIVQMFGNSNNFRAEIGSGGTTVANMSATGHTAGTFHKHCVSFSPTEAKYYVNGSQIGSTDTDLNIPVMTQIHLGVLNTSGNHLNGHIKRVAVFSEPVSATNAAALTS